MSRSREEIVNVPDFGDNIAITVGSSYLTGFFIGLARGIIKGMPKSSKLPRKLKMNNMFNSLGTETSKVGNAFGCIGFIYFAMGKTLNFFFEDQLDYLNDLQKNAVCGAFTGALYKSTLGIVPTGFGVVLGALMAASAHLLIEAGNQRGIIDF